MEFLGYKKLINLPKLYFNDNESLSNIKVYFSESNDLQKPYEYLVYFNNFEDKDCLVSSAVYFSEGDHVVFGCRHSDCLAYRNRLFSDIYEKRVCENNIDTFGGFLAVNPISKKIKFVDRKEALNILKLNNNQILRDNNIRQMLFSENLW